MNGAPLVNQLGERRSLSRWSWAIVLIYGVVVLGSGLMSGWALTQHEAYAAQPAREMLGDGNWFIPTFGGIPRKVKPPTTGWTIAAMMKLTGSEAEWVVRLPAMLSGVAIGAMIAGLTARRFGERAGVIAGLMQVSSVYILMQARLAEADMMLAACVVGAMCVFAWNCVDVANNFKSMHTASALFYLLAAMSLLYKGPVGPIFIFPACIVYSIWRRDGLGRRLLLSPIGIAVFILVAAIWPVPALIQEPSIWRVWYAETIGRAGGEMDGSKAEQWHFYLWNSLWLVLPWTLLAVVGAIAGVNRIRTSRFRDYPFAQFLLCWFVVGLLLVSLSAWKHKHYIIPILPAITPAAAVGAVIWLRHQHRQPRWRAMAGAIVWLTFCIVSAAAIYARPPESIIDASTSIAALLAVMGIGGYVVLLMEYLRRAKAQLAALFLTTAGCVMVFMMAIEPHFDGYRPAAEMSRRVAPLLLPGETVWMIGAGESQAAYYLPMPIRRVEAINGVIDTARIDRPAIALVLQRHLAPLSERFDIETLDPGVRILAPDRSKELLIPMRLTPKPTSRPVVSP